MMAMMSALLLPAAGAAAVHLGGGGGVVVTPFCKNSVRVQITPPNAHLDEDYQQQAALLANTLQDKVCVHAL